MQRHLFVWCVALVFLAIAVATPRAQTGTPLTPNYDLASEWTAQKVGRLVFDTTVTPRWLEANDRFWYSYQTRDGRKFYLVDPLKKAKAPLFDHARMAATLTAITREPYDAQHLPFTTVKFVKNDTAFQFDVQVPRDAEIAKPKRPTTTDTQGGTKVGGQDSDESIETVSPQGQRGRGTGPGRGAQPSAKQTLHFEYDLATGNVDLLDDDYRAPQRPRWASPSPDGKTVVFARNHNLFMMDADSFALAQKKSDDAAIKESQLTTDGEEHFSYARSARELQQEREQLQQQQQQQDQGEQQQIETDQEETNKNARVPAVQIVWSKESKRFALIRRDQRKVADLWVIDALAQPRPKLDTYRYAMPGEANVTQHEINAFDVGAKTKTTLKADRFKDQTLQIATAPVSARFAGGRGGGGGQGAQNLDAPPPQWLSDGSDKLYFTRVSRDLHKVDVCVAAPDTGDVKGLVEERLNTYIETKPLRLANNGQDLLFWSERTGWRHYYLYDAATGALKHALTSGEYVTTSIEGIDDKARVAYIAAVGKEPGEDPYYPHLYRVSVDGASLKLLNPGDANHAVLLADSNKYVVDNGSRVDGVPSAVLYDAGGNVVANLETPDVSALKEAGFKFPEPFKVKADDGVTDLYGVMYKPFDFDPARKYPVILFVYPGPQTESVTKTFNPRKDGTVTFEYEIETNSQLAKNLKGRLLLSTGEIDNNVHPANTMRLVDALIKANKRFDMLVMPGVRHGHADRTAYFNWIRADYFCRHLLGQAADSVDIVELNREKEQVGDKRPSRR